MSLKNKIRRFMEKKNLNPMNNRKKVGIKVAMTRPKLKGSMQSFLML